MPNLEPILQQIFEVVTKQAVASRVSKGNKIFMDQLVKEFKVEYLNGETIITAFVSDVKKRAVYKTSFSLRHFSPELISKYNLDYQDTRKDTSLSLKELYNFENFYYQKFIDELEKDQENLIGDVSCDCHELKKKDFCYHYYALLSALFAKIRFNPEHFLGLRGIEKFQQFTDLKLVTQSQQSDINTTEIPTLDGEFYGRKISNDLLKSIKKIASREESVKDYQFSGFNSDYSENCDLLKETFLEWLRRVY